LARKRPTFIYVVVLPLLPLRILLVGDNNSKGIVAKRSHHRVDDGRSSPSTQTCCHSS
jgi:hypothetical protein